MRANMPKTVSGPVAGVLAGLAWGLAFVLPVMLTEWTPVAITAGRYLAYGGVSLILFAAGGRALRRAGRRHWRAALGFALIGNVVFYLLLTCGIALAGAPLTTIVIGCLPIAITVVGNAVHKTRPWPALIAPIVLVLAGLAIVNVSDLETAGGTGSSVAAKTLGMLAALGAVALWTWYGLANARYLERHPDLPHSGWSTIVGLATGAVTLAALPVFILTGQMSPRPDIDGAGGRLLLGSLVLGVVASWAATGLWNQASARLTAGVAGILISIETVAGFAYVYAYLGRWPPFWQLAGFLLILAGVLTVVLRTSRASRPVARGGKTAHVVDNPAEARATGAIRVQSS